MYLGSVLYLLCAHMVPMDLGLHLVPSQLDAHPEVFDPGFKTYILHLFHMLHVLCCRTLGRAVRGYN